MKTLGPWKVLQIQLMIIIPSIADWKSITWMNQYSKENKMDNGSNQYPLLDSIFFVQLTGVVIKLAVNKRVADQWLQGGSSSS